MSNKANNRIPGIWFLIVLLLGFIGVVGRCFYLQYFEYERYKQRAERQQLKIVELSARRGMILDCKGRILAASRRGYSLAIDPKVMSSDREPLERMASILGLNGEFLYDDFINHKDERFMYVKRDITREQAEQLRNLGVAGVVVRREFFREYPMGSLAAAVLGITDAYNVGLEGLELQYDKYLRGEPGRTLYTMDVLRRPVGPLGENKPARDGYNLALTIDAVIQGYAEAALKKVVEKYQARDAICLVMEPHTGEILACASYPTFDLRKAREYETEQRKNNAINLIFEPGSIFKPITVACAVDKKVITVDTVIDCLDRPFVAKGMGRIGEYKNYFGRISVTEILAKSSNIGTAKIALAMGKDYFHGMIGKFGFGRKTYIDMPGEEVGIFPKKWTDKDYTFTRSAFGQGISVTPLQLLRAFCSFANGGRLVRPFVAAGITNDSGVVENFRRFSLPVFGDVGLEVNDTAVQIVSPETASQMIKALTRTVESGTGTTSEMDKWTSFGKTGTANVPRADRRGYETNKWNASFLAGAPASDPRVCILVTVREPNRSLGLGYTGGAVAGPAAKEILEQTLAYLMVEPDKEPEKEKKNR